MSMTDLTVGLFLMAYHVVLIKINTGNHTCTLIGIEQFFAAFLATCTVIITFFMTLDRYLFIKKTMFHSTVNEKYPVVKMIAIFTWLVAIAMATSIRELIYQDLIAKVSLSVIILFIILVIFYVIVLASVLAMNIALVRYIKIQAQQMRNLSNSLTSKRTHKKATKTVVWISFCQITTTIPPTCFFGKLIYFFATETDEQHFDEIYYMTTWLMAPIIVNSTLNAVVFISRNEKLKQFYRQKLFTDRQSLQKGISPKQVSMPSMLTILSSLPGTIPP